MQGVWSALLQKSPQLVGQSIWESLYCTVFEHSIRLRVPIRKPYLVGSAHASKLGVFTIVSVRWCRSHGDIETWQTRRGAAIISMQRCTTLCGWSGVDLTVPSGARPFVA